MHTENNIRFCSKEEIRALVAHASKDFTRVHLHCVLFTNESAVATDGHRLAILLADNQKEMPTDSGKRPDHCTVELTALESATKACKKGQCIRITHTGPNTATVDVVHDGERTTPLASFPSKMAADISFPPYLQVLAPLPTSNFEPRTTTFGVNPAYLADLVLVQKSANVDKGIQFYPPVDVLDPMRIQVDGMRWTVIVMPMRMEGTTATEVQQRAARAWPELVEAVRSENEREPEKRPELSVTRALRALSEETKAA